MSLYFFSFGKQKHDDKFNLPRTYQVRQATEETKVVPTHQEGYQEEEKQDDRRTHSKAKIPKHQVLGR